MINDDISIKPKVLREIMKMGYQKYSGIIGVILIDEKKAKQTVYQYLKTACNENENSRNIILASLQYIFEVNMAVNNEGFAYVNKDDKFIPFSEETFHEAIEIIKMQHCIKEQKEEFNPGNERARQLIAEIMKNRANAPKVKESITLQSIISGVAWQSHIGINAVWDLTIYQLYDAYSRLQVIDCYTNTLNGMYTGNIESSKINLKDIFWAKAIK